MADDDKDSKTEEPTSKRLGDARQKGQVAKSQEVGYVAVMLGGLTALYYFGGHLYTHVTDLMRYFFTEIPSIEITATTTVVLFDTVLAEIFFTIVPFLIVIAVVALMANLAQVGVLFTLHPLQPKFSKLNPLKGAKKFVSKQALVDLSKSLFKVSITGLIAFLTVMSEYDMLPYTAYMTTMEYVIFISQVSLKIAFAIMLVMVVVALADLTFQKYKHVEDLKMTKQEIKDENKQTEGNPEIKKRIKQKQFEMFQKRMMNDVPTADVIITNPTHFAVALKYQEGMAAPTVVAKGQDAIALKIREIATEHNVPIVEDKPVARALYKSAEIGDIIPPEMYQAVAEILAYVYRLNGNKAA